ncbi:hypothetical protein S40285_06955 [Stachybotrys chlorohalonatus IBT 40285]|uniref:Putative transcription factor kapC n=1 Tax=Stachybotrys chlorohalonatus (strain IBT 40285) TaxID=1283841 RepID=A0A084QV44_STAC4|nr:hypothetical protein S40285_06955 [Stachybotrys chlorohalonata IBT 40285]
MIHSDHHLRAQLEILKKHDAGEPTTTTTTITTNLREPHGLSSPSPLAPPANGYDHLSLAAQDAARALAIKSDADSHIHPDLRARPSMMPLAPPPGHSPGQGPAGPSNPSLAPAPPGPGQLDDLQNDGRKAKRELSQSKRAAQNRAAQRAFRQRKEGYIKKLEQQVREFLEMEQSYKTLQTENYALREYVIHLQSRLLDAQGEFPQPPPNVNLSQPPNAPAGHAPPAPTSGPDSAPSNAGVGTPLEAVAQAVAGLAAQEQLAERQESYSNPAFKSDDTRTADEINRQLQAEEPAQQSQ